MENPKCLWVLEDDKGCQFVYEEILSPRYRLAFFPTLSSFSDTLEERPGEPDLVIADVRLPDGSLLSFFSTRSARLMTDLPFIVVSSVDETDMLQKCFERGARDYLTKPFGKAELLFKIDRILQTAAKRHQTWKLEATSLTLERDGKRSETLTPKEFQILSLMMQAKDQTLPREEIVERVWGKVQVSPKTLDVHLSKLRRKIAPLFLEIEFKAPSSYVILDVRMPRF